MPFFFSPALSRRQKGSGSTSSVNATEAKQNASVQKKAHLKRTLSTIEEKDSLRYKAGKVKPWMDDDGNVVANIVLLVIYSVECMLRAFVERHNYLWNRWNQIDLLTVVLGWAGVVLAAAASFSGFQFNVLRITRVIRLLRAARVVISIPEFYILVSGLTSSFKAIIFGSVMLVSVIIVWAIIGVELLHPLNAGKIYPDTCWHCKDAFGSVQEAAVTIFKQIVAGDSWGEINEPLALEHPALIPLFFFMFMMISLGCMNLILAVIVERATEARENDQARKLQKKDAEREANMVELALLCDSMDVNGNGSLSLQEMLDGYDHNHHFNNLMQEMDIRRSDIRTIFNVLDGDCSGEVSYVEFCQQLGTCRKRDPVMMHSLIKYSVMEVQKILNHEIMDTLNEHTEALIEQREMLMEQLQLLHALPVDPKIKEVAQKRRAARVLRRQGKKQGKPQYFDENGTAATAYSSHGSDVQEEGSGMVAHQVVNSMESTCQSFEDGVKHIIERLGHVSQSVP
ncbi:Sodium channel protein type 11 subunit alpha (NaN) (Sensory neuron sodium channel 2) (Sodium channel protein type XI subunit alpha) (Voltage-gated sodium channel subunit alpha Nav1.9) [Durusdinium trenchii]|uniref:Sodium channel protein type 11 subunit alpha (NaN) (Sensory neuron sodium channel 2) (Sodium channel protein type XI subunit alpha) (Voltage-gated sodium channel subunit alpha Nav1.9) n=1 Tax=Durusdinium trenchii TaxID=1381693 RepID=A0ABP0RAP2_9DINO